MQNFFFFFFFPSIYKYDFHALYWLVRRICEWEAELMAGSMARSSCLAFCWKSVAWLHLCLDVALFLRWIKNHTHTCAPFYRSREVPMLTENNVFFLLALHCRASAAQISSKFPGMLWGNLQLWEFFISQSVGAWCCQHTFSWYQT